MWRWGANHTSLYPKCLFSPVSINKSVLMFILSGQHCCFSTQRRQQTKNHSRSSVWAPASINVRWRARLLKWNFTFAVRNHFRTLHSMLKRRAFQSCRFARQSRTVSTQTALTQQAPLYLHAECILLYLFAHFHLDKCCHCEEWEMSRPIVFTRQDKYHMPGT